MAAFVLVPVMLAIGAGRFVDLVLALVVCSCVIREDHVLSRTLSSRPLAHVGMVSYGMYLMHGLVYQCIRRAPILRTLHPVAQVPLAIAGTIAGASLSFRYFEKVFLQFKKHFVRVRIS